MFLLLTCLQKLVQESSVQDRQSLRLRPVHGLQAKEVHTAGQSRNVELLLMAALLFTLHDSPYLPSEHIRDGSLPFAVRAPRSEEWPAAGLDSGRCPGILDAFRDYFLARKPF